MDLNSFRQKLAAIGQESVLRFEDGLDGAGRSNLAAQLSRLDLDLMAQLVREYVKQKPQLPIPRNIRPVTPYPREPGTKYKDLYKQATARGMQLLRDGKVAAFLVAGGQGTRLGYDGPKGEYPITPVKNKPLFQVFAETLRKWGQIAGRPVAWYIMTSDINDGPTRAFFDHHRHFGCNPEDVFFFQQGMMPAFAMDGRMLLAEEGALALSPDGHGGSLRALDRSGALADMRRRGVEHLSYFQVDNPLVHCIDPLFLGLHDMTDSEMSSKTIPKAGPLERVGNFCLADAEDGQRLYVIEYSDLPDELAKQTNPDKSLKFNAGSIAIHALRVSFIERLNAGGQLRLPWHRAEKKVAYIDDSGRAIKPDKPNAIKLEQFVFDAIPLANNPLVLTTDRAEEFSPVKNAEGNDSPTTCRRDQVRRFGRWLRSAGVLVPMNDQDPAARIEISPLYAATAEHVRQAKPKVREVRKDSSTYLAGPDSAEVS